MRVQSALVGVRNSAVMHRGNDGLACSWKAKEGGVS